MKLNELEVDCDYFDFNEKFYQKVKPQPLLNAHLISYSKEACDLIDLAYEECETENFIEFINGEKLLKNSIPYAQVYAGHQFGYYVPQLGDGRAINLGKISRWHLQTKGAGLTRYSRQGDGRAVLRSSIREYIMSEAMHALGIPTTRALALIGSKHPVYRPYEEEQTGAIVLRLSTSWIRIGTFEYFAKQNDTKHLKQLLDYVIKNSYPHLQGLEYSYERFYFELVDRTSKLISQWMAYGFMHGVMNTDNMSIAGLTIDYGPYAFMDNFEMGCICNHTDIEGRYSYVNQPYIAKWNLEVLARALKDVCDEKKLLEYLQTFISSNQKHYLELMNKRLGLDIDLVGDSNIDLILELLEALEVSKCDYNFFFWQLTNLDSFDDFSAILDFVPYKEALLDWLEKYNKIVNNQNQDLKYMKEIMKKNNPKYIIKNYMLQEAIELAEKQDFTLVNDLLNIAQSPFNEHKEFERYAKPTPSEYANLQLSCSS